MKCNLINNSVAEKIGDNVIDLDTKKDSIQILWFSDTHLDNPKSQIKFMHKTIKDNPDALIMFGGDNLDVMSWKFDPRSEKSQLTNRDLEKPLFNDIIEEVRENIIKPYADRIIGVARGNHETALFKRLECDLHEIICKDVTNMLYTRGWINVKIKPNKSFNGNLSFPIFFQHIPTSGGMRSKGMLSVDILSGQRPDAKMIITEHLHTSWIHPVMIERFDNRTLKEHDELVWFVQSPTLKMEHKGRKQGYYHERVKAGAVLTGCVEINIKTVYTNGKYQLVAEPRILINHDYAG